MPLLHSLFAPNFTSLHFFLFNRAHLVIVNYGPTQARDCAPCWRCVGKLHEASHAVRCRLHAEGKEYTLPREGTGHWQVAAILLLIHALKNGLYFTEQERISGTRKLEAEEMHRGKSHFYPPCYAEKKASTGEYILSSSQECGGSHGSWLLLSLYHPGKPPAGPEGGEIGTQLF